MPVAPIWRVRGSGGLPDLVARAAEWRAAELFWSVRRHDFSPLICPIASIAWRAAILPVAAARGLLQHRPADGPPRPPRLCRCHGGRVQARDALEHRQTALRRHPEHGHGQSAGRGLHAGGRVNLGSDFFRELRPARTTSTSASAAPSAIARPSPTRRSRATISPGHDEPDPAKRAVRHGRDRNAGRSHARPRGATLNGLRNWTVAPAASRASTPDRRGAGAPGRAARRRRLGFRFESGTGLRTAHLLLEDREGRPLDPRARRLIEVLGLDPDLRSFPIRFGFSEGRAGDQDLYAFLHRDPRQSRRPGRSAA